MADNVIKTQGLTRYYGKTRGILDLDLTVKAGEVYGFLGPNGAGKTTTIRLLLDIIRPTRGQAHIFGLDSRSEGVAIRKRTGYLPGELSLYPNMTAHQYLDMIAGVRGQGGDGFRRQLFERLQLDPDRRMRTYSRGNKQKVGLVAALMGKPDLLILDEPTTGLDPLVQAEVLDLVREAREEGRTVFFSSHVLSEVQEVCDWVGIIRAGRLVSTESVESLIRQQFRRLQLTFSAPPPPEAFAIEGVRETSLEGSSLTLEVHQNLNTVLEKAAAIGVVDIETPPVSLEEVFLAYYSGKGGDHA